MEDQEEVRRRKRRERRRGRVEDKEEVELGQY